MECTNQHILMGMVTLKRDCEPMEKEKGKKNKINGRVNQPLLVQIASDYGGFRNLVITFNILITADSNIQ